MKGYVALTTILIIVPLLLLTGVSALYDNISSLSISKLNYDSQILRVNSQTCIEEAVYKVKRGTNFTGDIIITKTDWSCVINITDKVGYPGVRILSITAEDMNGIELSFSKELDTNPNPFTLTNIE